MDLLAKLTEDMKTAMRARDQKRLDVIRMLISDVKIIDMAPKPTTAEDAVAAYGKKLRKSVEEYQKLGKPDEVEKLKYEIGVVDEYLPKKASPEETERLVEEFLKTQTFTAKQFGQAMGAFMKAHGSQVDPGAANAALKKNLQQTGARMADISIHSVRAYADTSVYGGVFDEEFADASQQFFNQVKSGKYRLVTSPVLRDELLDAPPRVRELYEQYSPLADGVSVSEAGVRLQQAYLNAGIVSRKWETDALHVAIATVSNCRLIVSWNFKHIVNFQKIPLYNGVNLSHGYGPIAIHSPQEVIEDENHDENI